MKAHTTLAVAEAATKYKTPRNTLISWINKGHIQAERVGDKERSPWFIDEESLKRYLKIVGKVTEEAPPPEESAPNVAALPEKKKRLPSLRDHKIETPAPPEQTIDSSAIPAPRPPRESRGSTDRRGGNRHHRNHKRQQGPCYPIRITRGQLRDAIRSMSVDETLSLRDWLNDRLMQKLNPSA